MTCHDLEDFINHSGIARDNFSVNEDEKENTLSINMINGEWWVYHFERGERNVIGFFSTEEQACAKFKEVLDRIVRQRDEFTDRIRGEGKKDRLS